MEHSKQKIDSSLEDSVRWMYQHHLDTADVTFHVGKDGDEVKAHKFVLMCRSNVLFSMFAGCDPPKDALTIIDIKRDVFMQLLEFLYTDFTSVTADNFGDLMYCAKKYEIGILSTLCKKSLKNFNSTKIICQMMEFAQIYDDPEIVDICLETVEDQMPSFLYTDLFLQLCSRCVYNIARYDRMLAPEKVIFERVLKWSEEQCTRQNLPVTAKSQRKVLGDILYEIRFPIMDHEYLENVVCGSEILNDGDKVEILRQQLKSKKEKFPGRFKIHNRIWQSTAVMTCTVHPTRKRIYHVQSGDTYSLQFEVSAHAILLGIYLNIESYIEVQAHKWNVISSITPLNLLGCDTTNAVEEISTPLAEVKENLIEFYPRFFMRLTKGVIYSVSVRLEIKTPSKNRRFKIELKKTEQLRTPVAFNGKTLSVCRSSPTYNLSSDDDDSFLYYIPEKQFINGLWMT